MRPGRLTVLELFGKPKVYQLQVPVGIDQHIFRLHVSVCDALALMEELQDEDHLGNVETSSIFIEASGSPQVSEDLATWAIVKLSIVSMLGSLRWLLCEPACTSNRDLRSL